MADGYSPSVTLLVLDTASAVAGIVATGQFGWRRRGRLTPGGTARPVARAHGTLLLHGRLRRCRELGRTGRHDRADRFRCGQRGGLDLDLHAEDEAHDVVANRRLQPPEHLEGALLELDQGVALGNAGEPGALP